MLWIVCVCTMQLESIMTIMLILVTMPTNVATFASHIWLPCVPIIK